jgi:hypothetical protein
MSEENVEIVRGAIEAFSDGGIDAALEYCDPAAESRSGLWGRSRPTRTAWDYSRRADALEAAGLRE